MSNTTYNAIRDGLATAVPFVRHLGITLLDVRCGAATAILADTAEHRNHLGTLHAGALFTLGETASGAAIAGAIAPILQDAKPLAKTARIEYLRPARGEITATATIPDPNTLEARVSSNGRVDVLASVRLQDSTGAEVARIEVDWIVIGRRSSKTP